MKRAAVLFVLAVASCGGDDDSTADETTAEDGAAVDTTSPETATAATDGSAPTGTGTPSGSAGSEAEAWCDLSAELAALGGSAEATDPDALRQSYEEALELVARAEDIAPEEIADAVRTNAEGFRIVMEALDDVDYDVEQLDEEALAASLADADAANEEISAYEDANCDTGG